jgi:glutamate synthase domain-containing protein 1
MCGIVGFLDKRPGAGHPVGRTVLAMLQALSCRGPDSAGVALFGPSRRDWIAQIKLPEHSPTAQSVPAILAVLEESSPVVECEQRGAYLRVVVPALGEAGQLEQRLTRRVPGVEVVSLGRALEIVKQVGSPTQLDRSYGVAVRIGSHAIGHTRLSTESKVDLSHSQPFWAHGVPDLATVHNGHITNYHKLRRRYEQQGQRFYTENDSEVIGVYLRDRLARGMTLADALRSSLDDFDGSFCYLAASGDTLAYVKDRFGFKPLMLAETERFVAIATEEVALRQALGRDFVAVEPAPGTMQVWQVPQGAASEVSKAG